MSRGLAIGRTRAARLMQRISHDVSGHDKECEASAKHFERLAPEEFHRAMDRYQDQVACQRSSNTTELLSEVEISQTQGVADDRDGAQAHCRAGNDRAEKDAEPRIENSGGDRHA